MGGGELIILPKSPRDGNQRQARATRLCKESEFALLVNPTFFCFNFFVHDVKEVLCCNSNV